MARFVVGELVRIAGKDASGHVTMPVYARGKVGRIARVLRRFPDSGQEIEGVHSGLDVPLYRVRIGQADLWPTYLGGVGDVLELELYEHWLESVGRTGACAASSSVDGSEV